MSVEIKLPELAEGVEKADILKVLVKPGDKVDVETPLVELESEKATIAFPSPASGIVAQVLVKAGDTVHVGQVLIVLDGQSAEPAAPETEKPASKEEPQVPPTSVPGEQPRQAPVQFRQASGDQPIPAGPAVRRIARELGIDLRQVSGSGRYGRIVVEDLDPYIRGYVEKRGGLMGVTGPQAPELPDFSKWGPVRREKISSLRRKIAENLTLSWQSVPQVHQFVDADVTRLLEVQKRYKEAAREKGVALTLTPFLLKAIVACLQEFPMFNASYDAPAQDLIYKDYYHIGVAVDTANGLIVPVIRDVDKKSVMELAEELATVSERTRNRQISIDELRGATFTLSNLGGIGGGAFTPIVNVPEVAILGAARAVKRVAVDDEGRPVQCDFMPLCLAYDHRVIDGAEGARFVVRLAQSLELFEGTLFGL